MTETELFIASDQALTKVVDQIKNDQWAMEVPSYITPKGGTLRRIINYHAYDEAWVPDVLSGKTIAEVGAKYDGDLLGVDPKSSWHALVDKAIAAVKNISEEDLNKVAHLSYGDYPIREYLTHIVSFRAFRAVDIARFIGVDDTLEHTLVQGLWDAFRPHVETWRQMGVFSAEINVPEDAPLQERLLGLVGRKPKV